MCRVSSHTCHARTSCAMFPQGVQPRSSLASYALFVDAMEVYPRFSRGKSFVEPPSGVSLDPREWPSFSFRDNYWVRISPFLSLSLFVYVYVYVFFFFFRSFIILVYVCDTSDVACLSQSLLWFSKCWARTPMWQKKKHNLVFATLEGFWIQSLH